MADNWRSAVERLQKLKVRRSGVNLKNDKSTWRSIFSKNFQDLGVSEIEAMEWVEENPYNNIA